MEGFWFPHQTSTHPKTQVPVGFFCDNSRFHHPNHHTFPPTCPYPRPSRPKRQKTSRMFVQPSHSNRQVLVNEFNAKIPRLKSNSLSKVNDHSYLITILPARPPLNHSLHDAAVNHAQTYWSILERRKGSELRLTRMDQEIYDHLMEVFPNFNSAVPLDEDEMKSQVGKEKWRLFMSKYEKKVRWYPSAEPTAWEV